MKNIDYHSESVNLIEKMTKNKFLMPDCYSEEAFLPSWLRYSTYVDSSSRNYVNIYIKEPNRDTKYVINFTRWKIVIDSNNIFLDPVTCKKIYEQILEIYNLKFSFAESNEWRTALLEKISNRAIALREAEKALKKEKEILKDFDSLNNK